MSSQLAYVIYSEELGVYLGSCLGLGFWSKLDPAGQDYAVTFPSVEACKQWIDSWDSKLESPWKAVEVTPDSSGFASVASCVRAGLPAWGHATT